MHNVQPWEWRVGADSMHLYVDPTRRLEHTDPDGRDTMVSCGTALNHCVVALAALGWQSRVHRFPNPAEPSHLASIEVQPLSPARWTSLSRPRFRGVAPTGGISAVAGIAWRRLADGCEGRAHGGGHAAYRAHDGYSRRAGAAVWRHATDREYLKELTVWSGRYASTAGVPARSAPCRTRSSPVPRSLFAGTALAQPPDASPADDHGVLLALGTAEDDDVGPAACR